MLPMVLMVPLALMCLDFVVPRPLTTPMALVPFGWAPAAASSRRLTGEASAEQTLDEKLEKLLNTMNATVDNKGESGYESTVHHDQFYTDPYNPDGNPEAGLIAALMGMIVFVLIAAAAFSLSGIIFACQYKSKVTDRRARIPGDWTSSRGPLNGGDFRTGPFACFDDTPTCCHATFCGACRAGDTYEKGDVQQFWSAIGMFIVANIVGSAVGGLMAKEPSNQQNISRLVASLMMGGIFQGYRRLLRVRLGGVDPPIYIDFLLWAFCSCCVIAQEAREFDHAMGVRVECCCNLQSTRGPVASEMGVHPGGAQAFSNQPQVTGQPV